MEKLSKHNHVVRSDGSYRGKWGRGRNLIEAMDNAGANRSTPFTYYIFKEDTWDILNDGTVTFGSDDNLVLMQRFNNPDDSDHHISHEQKMYVVFGDTAIKMANDGVTDHNILNKHGKVCTVKYNSVDEMSAYIEALIDFDGWYHYKILE